MSCSENLCDQCIINDEILSLGFDSFIVKLILTNSAANSTGKTFINRLKNGVCTLLQINILVHIAICGCLHILVNIFFSFGSFLLLENNLSVLG
jgi:hypothetical protein